MARVLLLGNDEDGIYVFRRELISALVEKKYDVIVGFPFSRHSEQIRALGCEIVNTEIHRHGTSIVEELRLSLRYLLLLRQHRPDIVLTYTIKPNIYASLACQWCNVPYINNITGVGAVFQKDTMLTRLVATLQIIAYRKSSCVFFQNRANMNKFLAMGIVHTNMPIRLLPGSGVNLVFHVYESFPVDDGVIRFVTVGRIQRAKGYDELFDAAEKIKLKYPYTEFHVAGGFEEEKFKVKMERLTQAGIIVYHGEIMQEEVHRLIAKCNCLVHPTYHEGMSNVCLEAAAAGRPIVASDIPGCRETFDEGISGYGFKVKDADALYDALERFICTPIAKQAEMGKAGRQKMKREFDRQIVLKAYLEEIQKTLGHNSYNL